jgi:hypothetical protein
LEHDIEHHGLEGVLNMLAGVCYDKAEHLRSMWNEGAVADAWTEVGDALTVLEVDSPVRSISPMRRI